MSMIDWIVGGIGIEIGRAIASLGFILIWLPLLGICALVGWLWEKIRR